MTLDTGLFFAASTSNLKEDFVVTSMLKLNAGVKTRRKESKQHEDGFIFSGLR
jgi:hypothetical protein